jgi:hypothetical protein
MKVQSTKPADRQQDVVFLCPRLPGKVDTGLQKSMMLTMVRRLSKARGVGRTTRLRCKLGRRFLAQAECSRSF